MPTYDLDPAVYAALNVRAFEIEPGDWIGPSGGCRQVNSITTPLDRGPIEVRFTDGTTQEYRFDDMVQVARVPLPQFPLGYKGWRFPAVADVERAAAEALKRLRPKDPEFSVGDRVTVRGVDGRLNGTFEVTEIGNPDREPWEPQTFTSRRVHDEERS